MKILMYHSINKNGDYNGLTIHQFKKQLDYFKHHWDIMTRKEFLKCLQTGNNNDNVVLTFDDGLSCHYDIVYPILKERGLFGVFFASTGQYEKNKLLNVHRTHYLLDRYNSKKIFEYASKLVTTEMVNEKRIEEYNEEVYKDQNNSEFDYKTKRLLNYYLKPMWKDQILDIVMGSVAFNLEQHIANEFYMSLKQMKKMSEDGMLIGSHTISHPLLSELNEEQQEREIIGCHAFLKEYLKLNYGLFAYPYGGKSSFNATTKCILHDYKDIDYSFIVEGKEAKEEVIHNVHKIPRLDCNGFLDV